MLSAKASKGKIILNQIHPYEKVRENSTLARKKGYFFKEERALIFSQYNYFLLGNLHKTLSNKDKKKAWSRGTWRFNSYNRRFFSNMCFTLNSQPNLNILFLSFKREEVYPAIYICRIVK
jgi:hypothetical protein